MKQVLCLFPAALALVLTTAPMQPALAKVAAVAQRFEGKPGGKLEQLNLTDAQKSQMQQIRASSQQQLEAILTPEQRQKMDQARQNRQRPALNLSDDQKSKIKALRQNTRSQIEAILTAEQRQQWEKIRGNR